MIKTRFYLTIEKKEISNFDLSMFTESILFKPTSSEFDIIDFDEDEINDFINNDLNEFERLNLEVQCYVPTKHFMWDGKAEFEIDEWKGEIKSRCIGFEFNEIHCNFMEGADLNLEFDEDENDDVYRTLSKLTY